MPMLRRSSLAALLLSTLAVTACQGGSSLPTAPRVTGPRRDGVCYVGQVPHRWDRRHRAERSAPAAGEPGADAELRAVSVRRHLLERRRGRGWRRRRGLSIERTGRCTAGCGALSINHPGLRLVERG